MPEPTILRFNDPDEFQSYYERTLGGSAKATIMTPGAYSTELTEITLGDLTVSRTRYSLPRIMSYAFPKKLATISFYTSAEQAPALFNGQDWRSDYAVVAPAGSEAFSRSHTEIGIGNLSIAPDKFAMVANALLGYVPTVSPTAHLARQPSELVRRMRHLHGAICHLAGSVPDVLGHSEVTRVIEQELLRALVHCFADRGTSQIASGSNRRIPIMRRFEQMIGERLYEPLYVSEVCAAIGVSERTLRNHCMQYLGVNPHRYLWLRRMNQVRRALILADPTVATVTKIALDHGFWELGRFATAYRRLFNESPSITLRSAS